MARGRQRRVEYSRLYGFVRSRQLEGTLYTKGPEVGCFIQTARRVHAGYGTVAEWRWPYPQGNKLIWPPPEPVGLDEVAKFSRNLYHFRIRTLDECRLFMHTCRVGLQVNLPISLEKWHQAKDGEIALPSSLSECDLRHAVYILGYDDSTQRFNFANSWGESWGNRGYGTLPYEYVMSLSNETWSYVPPMRHHWMPFGAERLDNPSNPFIARATFLKEGPVGYSSGIIDLWQPGTRSRIGWAMLSIREGFVDIEDYFIMPQHQGGAHEKILYERTMQVCEEVGLPYRFIVGHVDTDHKTAGFAVVNDFIRRSRGTERKSHHVWAAWEIMAK